LLAFQSKEDLSLWTCPFHPPLKLFFIIRNTRQLQDFGLAKIKVWNYWTTDGVSNGSSSEILSSPWVQGGPAVGSHTTPATRAEPLTPEAEEVSSVYALFPTLERLEKYELRLSFRDKDTETQRGSVTCPKSHSQSASENKCDPCWTIG
jgi:hypothetical protein